jgi:hypothetical protein
MPSAEHSMGTRHPEPDMAIRASRNRVRTGILPRTGIVPGYPHDRFMRLDVDCQLSTLRLRGVPSATGCIAGSPPVAIEGGDLAFSQRLAGASLHGREACRRAAAFSAWGGGPHQRATYRPATARRPTAAGIPRVHEAPLPACAARRARCSDGRSRRPSVRDEVHVRAHPVRHDHRRSARNSTAGR